MAMIQLAEIENKISGFSPFRGFHIDQALFEADYPVLFSGIIGHQEYLLGTLGSDPMNSGLK